jgi:hypothetical protein
MFSYQRNLILSFLMKLIPDVKYINMNYSTISFSFNIDNNIVS